MTGDLKIAILGAGAIGCEVGGILAGLGFTPTLIGRDRVLDPIRENGLTRVGQEKVVLTGDQFSFATSAKALADADLIFVATKATGLKRVVADLSEHVSTETPIVSLLNGVAPARDMAASLPDHTILAGMFPYNVVWLDDTTLKQSSIGKIALTEHPKTRAICDKAPDMFTCTSDLGPLQYGKLLRNLINPVNALSGMPVLQMLADQSYRRVFGDAIAEALKVYAALGIKYDADMPLPTPVMVRLINGPDWLFRKIILPKQNLDPDTMSSMASDYQAKRETEIDVLNGEIVQLGQKAGVPTPVNSALVDWIRAAPDHDWSNPTPAQIRSGF